MVQGRARVSPWLRSPLHSEAATPGEPIRVLVALCSASLYDGGLRRKRGRINVCVCVCGGGFVKRKGDGGGGP